MVGRFFLTILFFSSLTVVHGQRTPALPPEMNPRVESQSEKAERGLRELRSLDIRTTREDLPPNIHAIYRKPSKKEIAILAPDQKLVDQHVEFLKQPNTGILKLNPDELCAQNVEVVTVADSCRDYKMPGGGTAFSFRNESYRIPRLADLMLAKDILKSDGIWQQGLMVSLGNVPIDTIDSSSKGVKLISDLKPVTSTDEFADRDKEFLSGIRSDGYSYGLGFYAKNDTTYALRSIAYRFVAVKSYKNVYYNELAFDRREDILVVFRVINIEPTGHVTLLWKELSRQKAPELKLSPPK